MRAIRSDGKTVSVVTDDPALSVEPRSGEAVVKVKLAGVSGSDAALVAHPERCIGIPGQEGVGVVQSVKIADDAPAALREKKSLVGKRVFVWPYVVCGHCEWCRGGLSAQCRSRQTLGAGGMGAAGGAAGGGGVMAASGGGGGGGRPGCLAERVVVPIANLFELPAAVSDDVAIFGVTLARAIHTRHLMRGERSGGSGGSGGGGGVAGGGDAFVTVIGDNLLALLTAQALRPLCPSLRVLVSGAGRAGEHRVADATRLLERWGIKHRSSDDAGRRNDQSVVVECTGTAAGFRLALQHVRPRGTLILKSAFETPRPGVGTSAEGASKNREDAAIDLTPVVSNELRVLGSGDGSATEAIQSLVRSEYDVSGLIAKRYRAEQGVEALREAVAVEPMKVVVEW